MNTSRKGIQAQGFLSFEVSPSLFLFAGWEGGTFLLKHHRNFKSYLITLLLLCGAFACNSCSAPQRTNVSEVRTITDEAGREVRLYGKIERVISLAPNLTEIIYAVNAGDLLVGNTTYCDYPEQARSVQKVGDTLQPNIERILALRPNLIFISTSSQLEAFARQLNEHGIPVYVSDPHDLEGVIHSIENLSRLLDRQQQASELVGKLRSRMNAVQASVQGLRPVTVFYQLSAEPLYTAGRDAFVTDLMKRAGGASVTAEVPEAWPRYSEESAVAARPEAIVLPTGGSMGAANAEVAAGLKKSPAVLNGRVIKIDGDLLVRPGPRAIDGLEQLARALHPEAF